MKKIVLALLVATGLTHATGDFELPPIDLCTKLGIGCPGPVGPEGPMGPQGLPGKDGIDGIDGKDGLAGMDGRDGIDGKDGMDGAKGDKGDKGDTGLTGATGAKGDTGATGKTGATGLAGADGRDGIDFNSKGYEIAYYKTIYELRKASKTANQAVAGSVSISAIDFGTTCKGKTEVGAGVGVSDSYIGTDYAGAIGIKHGFTDTTAGIVKGWKSKNSHAVGAAVTYAF